MNATKPDRCLDAETLAAWLDGGLDAAALAAAEAHVSNCDRCQALVATMMKTLPAEAVTARAGVRLWRWWLAPIAAATAAVVIWAVVPQRSMAPAAEQTSMVAAEPAVAAPEPASPPVGAPQTAPQAPAARDNAQERFSPVPGTPPAPRRRQELADAAKRPSESDRLAAAAADREARVDTVTPAPPAPRAAAQAPAAPPAAMAPPPAAPATAMAEAAPAREEKAANRAATAAGAPAPAEMQKRMQQAAPLEVVSPDRARRWRIVNGQLIERTDDNGATWRLMGSVADVTLSAGSAPSNTVAWFVGNAGVVLLTTDGGATLQRLNIGERLDLASVSAADARTAIVSTANGRRFRTEDGGRTWRPF